MKRFFQALIIAICLVAPVVPAHLAVAASSDQQLFSACSQAPGSSICKDQGAQTDPVIRVINDAANIVALLTGIAAVILIIVSGLTMITSAGNQEAVATSRRRITSALIGAVVVALAWAITRFVTDKVLQ